MLMHSELCHRLREKNVGIHAIGLYFIAAGYSIEHGSPGRLPVAAMAELYEGADGELAANRGAMRALEDACFWELEADTQEIVFVDWGEWIVRDGEAGAGAD